MKVTLHSHHTPSLLLSNEVGSTPWPDTSWDTSNQSSFCGGYNTVFSFFGLSIITPAISHFRIWSSLISVLKSVAQYLFFALSCISQKFAIWSLPGGIQFLVVLSAILSHTDLDIMGIAIWSSRLLHYVVPFSHIFLPRSSLFLLWFVHFYWYLSACEGCRISCSLFWTFYFLCPDIHCIFAAALCLSS